MPLITMIERDGQRLQLRWGDFHIACMALASSFEAGDNGFNDPSKIYEVPAGTFDCYPDAPLPVTRHLAFMLSSYPMIGKSPLNAASYTLTKKHRFRDTSEGEILELLPGDVLTAVRES